MSRRTTKLAAVACALALTATTATTAQAVNIVNEPSTQIERALDLHRHLTRAVIELRDGVV